MGLSLFFPCRNIRRLPITVVFVCSLILAAESTAGEPGTGPAWLTEIRELLTSDEREHPGKNVPLDENGRRIDGIAIWEKRRTELQNAWIEHLGSMVSVRETGVRYDPPSIEILEEVELDGLVRRKILYETEKGQNVRAYLMMPRKIDSPRPGVVVFHGTNEYSYHQTAGVYDKGIRATGYHLARKGYVTLCPQNFIWPCSDEIQIAYREVTAEFRKRNPDQWGMARMILDAQVAVDILVSLPEVDPERIGCTGHSLGGKQALYLPAFDRRVFCSASSEGGIGIEQSNWEADWYLGPDAKKPGFPLSHHDIVAMIAPRPFLLVGGNASDGDESRPYIVSALSIYRLYGESARIGFFNHKKGHAMPPETETRINEWFDAFLAP